MAQLVERDLAKVEAAGSSPVSRFFIFTKRKGYPMDSPFFVKEEPKRALPTFEFFASLRSLQNQGPPDLVQRLAQEVFLGRR